MPKLSWKRDPKKTGLSAIGSSPREYELHSGETVYARVSPLGGGYMGPLKGWYWVAGWDSDIPGKNTCGTPCETPEEAKKQALEYVKANLPKPT